MWRMLAALAAAVTLSQFHRAALAVVSPELTAELSLTPGQTGALTGAFFLALGVAQIPVGLALDRVGPRATVGWLTGLAVLGAAAQGLAWDGPSLLAARFLLGLGCSASFMASVVLCSRWFAGRSLTGALSRITAFSQLGLVEMTRKRTRESLAHVLCEQCPVCTGKGQVKTARTVCYDILREIMRESRQFNPREFRILASQEVIDLFLEEESQHLAMLGDFIGKPISLQVESTFHQEQYDIILM